MFLIYHSQKHYFTVPTKCEIELILEYKPSITEHILSSSLYLYFSEYFLYFFYSCYYYLSNVEGRAQSKQIGALNYNND